MNILILGVNRFIGQHLTLRLLQTIPQHRTKKRYSVHRQSVEK